MGPSAPGWCKILQENAKLLEKRLGIPIVLKRIADLDVTRDRGVKVNPALLTPKVSEVIDDPEISIVVELMGGLEPARTFILQAIESGKHIVTANKALLAVHGAGDLSSGRRSRRGYRV